MLYAEEKSNLDLNRWYSGCPSTVPVVRQSWIIVMLNTERNFCIKARQAETQQQGTLPRVSRQIHGEFVAYYQRKGDEKRYEENFLPLASRKKPSGSIVTIRSYEELLIAACFARHSCWVMQILNRLTATNAVESLSNAIEEKSYDTHLIVLQVSTTEGIYNSCSERWKVQARHRVLVESSSPHRFSIGWSCRPYCLSTADTKVH